MEAKALRSVRIKIFDFENKARDVIFNKGQKLHFGKVDKIISDIIEENGRILIYTKQKDEVQLWKDEPKNEYVTVEYENDEL